MTFTDEYAACCPPQSAERRTLRAAWKITSAGPHDVRDFLTTVWDLRLRVEAAEAAVARVRWYAAGLDDSTAADLLAALEGGDADV